MIVRDLVRILSLVVCAMAPASAAEIYYFAALSGAAQAPANNSPSHGTAVVFIDTSFAQLHIEVEYSELAGQVTSAHIQGLTANPGDGLADSATSLPTLSGFADGATSGSYHGVLGISTPSTYNPAFVAANGGGVAAARNALIDGLNEGRTYFNIRTTAYPDGELRGFLAPAPTADFDHNGRVNGTDLVLVELAFGSANLGDADQDGDTDGDDALAWQRQLGDAATIPQQGEVQSAIAPVPEPACALLATFGLVGLGAFRRGRM